MSQKYHISPKTGAPSLCKAVKQACPLGDGSAPHFSSISEAREYIEKQYESSIDITKSVSSAKSKTKVSPTPNNMKIKIQKSPPKQDSRENDRHRTNAKQQLQQHKRGQKLYFQVVGEIPQDKQKDLLKITPSTKHMKERNDRFRKIEDTFGHGKVAHTFIIDKNHKDGNEIHQINDNGCIYIFNYKTGKMITCLIARPGQIRRYFENSPNKPSKDLIDKAFYNQQQGYNEW